MSSSWSKVVVTVTLDSDFASLDIVRAQTYKSARISVRTTNQPRGPFHSVDRKVQAGVWTVQRWFLGRRHRETPCTLYSECTSLSSDLSLTHTLLYSCCNSPGRRDCASATDLSSRELETRCSSAKMCSTLDHALAMAAVCSPFVSQSKDCKSNRRFRLQIG